MAWDFVILKVWIEDGETAQQSRALPLLQRTCVQFSASTWWLTPICDRSSRESKTLFRLLGTPDMYMLYLHTCRHIKIILTVKKWIFKNSFRVLNVIWINDRNIVIIQAFNFFFFYVLLADFFSYQQLRLTCGPWALRLRTDWLQPNTNLQTQKLPQLLMRNGSKYFLLS